jgi:hypothetical protein
VNTKTVVLITVCAIGALTAEAGQPAEPQPPAAQEQTSSPAFTHETAVIEEVIAAVDDGYRFRACVVRWHGARVLVSDPLANSHGGVGDSIRFIVSRHDVDGMRLLSFTSVDHDADRHKSAPQKEIPDSSITSDTATIDEVLRAEDGGYRFTAYLATWHGTRIAVSDPLARSHGVIGGPVTFAAMHTGATGERLLSFINTDQSTAARSYRAERAPARSTAPETGIVDEVLTTEADGYHYRAYVVQWRGSRIVVSDEEAVTHYQVGDGVTFLSQHLLMPGKAETGVLSFAWSNTSDGAAPLPFAGHISITNDTATIEEVLTNQVESCRFVAYIVRWHGARVAISDMFASTHYVAGDRLEFPVSRSEASGQQQLRFMLFNFPPTRPTPSNPQSSRDGPTQARTQAAPL